MRPSECESKRRVFILGPGDSSIQTRSGAIATPMFWPGGPTPIEETSMARTGLFSSNRSILLLVACICFAIAVLTGTGIISTDHIAWTDLGLFFGFLSFLL